MDTNRLSKTMYQALNGQLAKEAHAAQIYLSYAAWADSEGYKGIANFLFRHSAEERNHMMKVLEYILKRGCKVNIEAIPAPFPDPASVNDCFEQVFNHEVDNTNAVYHLVNMSLEEKDWTTWSFMQWFVKEQTEEETMAMDLIAKLKIAGDKNANGDALYNIDRELAGMQDDAEKAEDATTEKP